MENAPKKPCGCKKRALAPPKDVGKALSMAPKSSPKPKVSVFQFLRDRSSKIQNVDKRKIV